MNTFSKAVIILNELAEVVYVNNVACEYLGYYKDEMIMKNWFYRFILNNIQQGMKQLFMQLMSGDLTPFESHTNEVITKDNQNIRMKRVNSLIKDDDGLIKGTLSIGEKAGFTNYMLPN